MEFANKILHTGPLKTWFANKDSLYCFELCGKQYKKLFLCHIDIDKYLFMASAGMFILVLVRVSLRRTSKIYGALMWR